MGEPLENEYFNWLCAKVLDDHNSRNYYTLLLILYKTEFKWMVHADRHRADDGIELRSDFLRETNFDSDPYWEDLPCSVLEVMIAFANRAQFQTDISVKDWFWEFMTNLNLSEYRRISDAEVPVVENILHTFIYRNYDPRGNGGMFPMRHTENDQRDVEIWYQFCEYLEDRGIY